MVIGSQRWSADSTEVVKVSGTDAERYLQSQLSQDISQLTQGNACWSLLLQPEGRLGWLLRVIHRTTGEWLLLGAAGSSSAICRRLQRFAIRTDAHCDIVRLFHVISDDQLFTGAEGFVLPSVLEGHGGIEWLSLYEPELDGTRVSGDVAREWHVLLPALDSDDVLEGSLPNELGDAVGKRSVSFTKGCYPGQEMVARLDARSAAPPYPMLGFEADGWVSTGLAITNGKDEVGEVLRVSQMPESTLARGIARVARAHAAGNLRCGDVALRFVPLL